MMTSVKRWVLLRHALRSEVGCVPLIVTQIPVHRVVLHEVLWLEVDVWPELERAQLLKSQVFRGLGARSFIHAAFYRAWSTSSIHGKTHRSLLQTDARRMSNQRSQVSTGWNTGKCPVSKHEPGQQRMPWLQRRDGYLRYPSFSVKLLCRVASYTAIENAFLFFFFCSRQKRGHMLPHSSREEGPIWGWLSSCLAPLNIFRSPCSQLVITAFYLNNIPQDVYKL